VFRFYLLGELRAYLKTERLDLPPFRTHSLLATLLLRPGLKPRYQLSGLTFPDLGETDGRRRLSDLLYLLRKTWPDLPLEARSDSLGLDRDARWLDVEAFKTAASQDDLESWLQALALYQRDLLGGYCEDWLLEEREGLVQQKPYDEQALRLLMQLFFTLGRRDAALAAYERFLVAAYSWLW
jgi:DNA-binding SARP family transcriptional activator